MKAQWLTLRRLAIILIVAALVGTATGYLVDKGVWAFVEPFQTLIGAFYANVSTELLSIVVTIVVIDALNERRAIAREKRQLISQMGSRHNEIATDAIRLLHLRDWGFRDDTTLHGASLIEANLQGANLSKVNLQGAELVGASLDRARLWDATLVGANLSDTSMQEAELNRANLQGASLAGAYLEGGSLYQANMQGVSLWDASLQGVNLGGANLQGVVLTIGTSGEVFEAKFDTLFLRK